MKNFFFSSPTTFAYKFLVRGFSAARILIKASTGIVLFLFHSSLIVPLSAQPTIQWQKTLGGSTFEEIYSIQQTTDGGFVMVGVTLSNNGDVSGNHGGFDFWVVKMTVAGDIQWKKAYGGSNNDWPYSIQQTNDGGYIMTGLTMSNNGDVFGNHGDRDCWVVKLNEVGIIQWQKTLGGSGADEAFSVKQTNDSGYIVAGSSGSNDGDVSGNHGYDDTWVVKLSETGAIQWQKSLGGSSTDIARCIIQTMDGGYIMAGESDSNDGDVSVNYGNPDFWIVKLDGNGSIEWEKSLGGPALDVASAICQLGDGSYVVTGYVGSGVPGHHGSFDYMVVKLSSSGEVVWDKVYGGSSIDQAFDIQPTTDGGFVVIGHTQSVNGDVLNNNGGKDFWVLKLNEAGEISWQKTLGGSMGESGYSIRQTNDGGYILGGFTWSTNGDLSGSGNQGESDFWVVKLSHESVGTEDIATQSSYLEIYPNPASHNITLQLASEEPALTLRITDLLARQLSHQTISNGGSADISALPNGFYLLTATTPSGKVFSGKFRKQE
ncbi:MAG: T9SS type A sorting domain-containing protein [Lewinellaceae bacterium]|nr:T9SS type A sorting domain-containing protein [Lewinellaceae bacterium]